MAWVRYLVLGIVLLVVSWSDWRYQRIPNAATVFLAVAGLLTSLADGGTALFYSLNGFTAGLGIGIVLWLLSIFRAGDAKLLAAMGAVLGLRWIIACLIWAVLVGALVGLIILLVKGTLRSRMKKLWNYLKMLCFTRQYVPYEPEESKGELPFAPCLAVGAVLAIFAPFP